MSRPAASAEPTLTYPLTGVPGDAETRQVGPGIHWLRMPLPYALDHINLWLLEDGDGWTVIDSGLNTGRTRGLWEQVFADKLGGRPVTRVIVTHHHPDHVGLAGWLTEYWGAPLGMAFTEYLFARLLTEGSPDSRGIDLEGFFGASGLPDHHVAGISERASTYLKIVSPLPRAFSRIMDGDTITIGGRQWRVIVGQGHAPEHLCLYCDAENILISGDQILPRISPNISVWPQEPEADPLRLFLTSIERYRALPEDVLVLPSHNRPFIGLHTRIDELIVHHDGRLAALHAACAEPRTVLETLPFMFDRELDLQQSLFGLGESIAHLNYLMAQGRIKRATRDDGIWLYRQAP